MNFLKKLFFSITCVFYVQASIVAANFSATERNSTIEAIKKLALSFVGEKTFTLREIVQRLPLIKEIPLPPVAKKLLDGVKFFTPQLRETKNSVELTFQSPYLWGQKKAITSRIYAGPNAKGKKFGFTFGIGVPGLFSYGDIFPSMGVAARKLAPSMLPKKIAEQFKKAGQTIDKLTGLIDWVKFKNMGMVLSVSKRFDDPVWGILVKGINIVTQVKLGGPLEKLTNFFGKELTTAKFRGTIVPTSNLAGSSISATYMGTIPLLKFPGFELRTSTRTLAIGLEEMNPTTVVPWIWGSTGLQIKLPGQKDFVDFKGFLTVYVNKLDIGGQVVGMIENLFAIPGLDLGNLGLMVTVNYVIAAATLESVPIHGGAITGEIQIGSKRLKLLAKITPVDPPALPDIVFEGAAEGGLSRSDIIAFALKLASQAAHVRGVRINPEKLKGTFEKILPPFTIGDYKALLVLRTSVVFGKLYSKGFHIKSYMNFAGLGGGAEFSASIGGIKGKIYYDQIKIPKNNPIIVISGAGPDKVRGTKDDGPIGSLDLSWKNQELFIDGLASIPLLGIKGEAKIDITPIGGIKVELKQKLGGLFESELQIEGRPESLDTFKVSGFVDQKALNKLRSVLVDKAGAFAQKADANLKAANKKTKQEIDAWLRKQIEKFDQKIADVDKKIATAKKECEDSKKRDKKLKYLAVCAQKKIQIALLKNKRNTIKIRRKIKWDQSMAKVAKGTIEIISRATRGALKTAKKLSTFAGKLIGGGFNISEIRFKGTLVDLIRKTQGIKAFVRGRIAGKSFKQEFQFDLRKPGQLPQQILRALQQIVH